MKIEKLLLDGFHLLKGNKLLLALPALKYIVYILLFVVYGILLLISAFALSFSGPLFLILSLILSAAGLLAFIAVTSLFSAALIGASSDVVDGKTIDPQSFIDWAKKKFKALFIVNAILYLFWITLVLFFIPTIILFVKNHFEAAATLGLLTASVVVALMILATICFIPLSYIVVLREHKTLDYLRASIRFVKQNIVAVAMIWTTLILIYLLLNSVTSIVTGPPQLIPYLGTIISGFLSIIFFIVNSTLIEAQMTIWWVSFIKQTEKV